MFHAEIGNLHQFVTVFVERILPEPVLESSDHSRCLPEVLLSHFKLVAEHPIVHGQGSCFTFVSVRVVRIVPDVDVDAIVVDRLGHTPHKRPGFLLEV